jgi:2-keto-3-deoxy-L-rhamnonate aldolase RhmA
VIDNAFRSALLRREVTLGTWLQINSATAAEVLANAGYDWIAIDIEHTDIDVLSLTQLLRGMHGRGVAPIARVSRNDVLEIRRALDVGSTGVLVPFVNTADEARHAVAAAKYPPLGVRGFSFSRANDWGVGFEEEARSANEATTVIVMIESHEGVAQIEEIVSVPGVDAAFIGPYDLSGSYGIPGQTDDPRVRAACRRVIDACEAAAKSVGLLLVRPTAATVRRAVGDGYTLICIGIDTVFLDQGARAARALALSALQGAVPDRGAGDIAS